MLTQKGARKVVRKAGNNGFEAYRQLCLMYGTSDQESGKCQKASGAPLFNQEDLDEINPLTQSVAFDTLSQDESLSEDVREIMRMKYK